MAGDQRWISIATSVLGAWLLTRIVQAVVSVYFGPLSHVPGPKLAAATTWWRAYIEVVKQVSWTDKLVELHSVYGDAVRVAPNELHFSPPSTYHEIYNNTLRWDKDEILYHSFGEDHSSFGVLTYNESKKCKDGLTPLFSRRAVVNMQGLIQDKVNQFCEILTKNDADGKSSDLFLGFRCLTNDIIMCFCFARSVDALNAPGFKAPIIEAMDASGSSFPVFRNFPLIRRFLFALPPWLSIWLSPATAGIFEVVQVLRAQVTEVVANPELLQNAPHPIIYHELLKPREDAAEVPSFVSLCEEAQTLVFAGSDTVGNTLMLGTFHVLENTPILWRVKEEVLQAWPVLSECPKFEQLEKLPFLTAVIKESLRISPNVSSPLTRVVPSNGATISGTAIPGGTVVGMSSIFVHNNESIYKDAFAFNPERWLGADSKGLDTWLVPFSKGPRSCIGSTLAWCELYIAFAAMFRRFDMKLDDTRVSDLTWRDCFLPFWKGNHLKAFCKPVER